MFFFPLFGASFSSSFSFSVLFISTHEERRVVRVHAVLGHQQPVHRGPLKTPVPSRAGDGPPVFDRRALVEVGKQRQRHSGRVFEPALPLLLGPHEEQVLRHFTGERAEPGARGREDGGLGPGVARLRAPGALAALAAEFPAYDFFFFFFFFVASEGLYYSLHIFMLYNDNQLHHLHTYIFIYLLSISPYEQLLG